MIRISISPITKPCETQSLIFICIKKSTLTFTHDNSQSDKNLSPKKNKKNQLFH